MKARAALPTGGDIAGVAQAIARARQRHEPADAGPWATALGCPDDAYAVQARVAGIMEGAGAGVPRYWKSGGPSREAPPTHAALPMQGVWHSPADARAWPFTLRLIEAEIALRLGCDVTAAQARALTPETAAAVVDAMAVSIEIVDSRWRQGVEAPALLRLADLQSHGALVLGAWTPFAPRDWSRQSCRVAIGSARPAQRWRGTHALDDPAWVLAAWLRHAARNGATVPRGTVVTTGTWCGMLPASAGDLVLAQFDGIGEAVVQL